MTLLEFFGCSLIAFGPALAMFIQTIANNSINIIILISSAFFWLCALLFSSITWTILSMACDSIAISVITSVLFQEMFRYLFYLMVKYAESGLQRIAKVEDLQSTAISQRLILSYVSGLGYGIISGAFALVNVLADSVGPGTVGLYGDNPKFFLISAFLTLAFVLLNMFWSVIYFKALDINNYMMINYVFASHLIASLMTLLNKSQLYWISIPATYINLLGTAILAFFSAGGTVHTLKQSILN